MKNAIIFFSLLIMLSVTASAQSNYDKLKNLYLSKDYAEAAQYISAAIGEKPKDIDVYILAGDVYFELEKPDQALNFYKKAADIKENSKILRKIGRANSALGNHSEAVMALRAAVEEDPKDAYNLLELGNAYLKADSMRQAELVITKARELNKSIPDAYIALGDLYFAQKVYELARSNYEEALAIDERFIDARIKLATAYYWLANKEMDKELSNELFARSLKEWSRVANEDPKNFKAFFQCGKILFLARRYADAASYLNRYIKLKPDGSLGRWYLSQSLFEIGKCDSAIPHLEIVAKEIDSVKDRALLKLAQCYFEQKKFIESIGIYSQLKIRTKLEIVDIERYAAAAFRTADTVGALKLYKELVDMDTSKCNLMFQLGSLTLFMKKYEESLYFFLKNYRFCKDTLLTAKIQYYLGNCYYYLGKTDSAKYYLNKSIESDPKLLSSKVFLANVHTGLKETVQAEELFKTAIDMGLQDTAKYGKELSPAFAQMCGLYLELKKYKELNKTAKQWTDFDQKSSIAFLYLAISYQGLKDTDNSCKSYKKVLQLDPKNTIAKKNLEALNCQ